jgi:glycosyltransferase involved in cell wall biosynthesis
VRANLGIAEEEVLALLVATLRPEKRAELFVEALRRANAREPRLRGAIAGGGPQLAQVRALAKTTRGIVQVLGERSDAADLIQAADVVCLTSAFEALPISVLEAMAMARPVLAMRVGGIPDAVEDGHTGRLVPPGELETFVDALVLLAGAPHERQAFGKAGRAAYERRYTLEQMIGNYAELLS